MKLSKWYFLWQAGCQVIRTTHYQAWLKTLEHYLTVSCWHTHTFKSPTVTLPKANHILWPWVVPVPQMPRQPLTDHKPLRTVELFASLNSYCEGLLSSAAFSMSNTSQTLTFCQCTWPIIGRQDCTIVVQHRQPFCVISVQVYSCSLAAKIVSKCFTSALLHGLHCTNK